VSFQAAEHLDTQFLELLDRAGPPGPAVDHDQPVRVGSRLTGGKLLELLESQMVCRHLDFEARRMRSRDEGYYTIASAGHEGNVVLGDLLHAGDPCFLHYRSGALMAQHARKDPEADFLLTTALSLAASRDDPVSGGRHKVWGSTSLFVPPQTSTISSHLPKAVGAALAIDRAWRIGQSVGTGQDAVVMCSFGDASVNHSTAQGALNSANWLGYQQIPTPLLFLCEDNGTGISVPTPPGWIENSVGQRPGLLYFSANGLDIVDAYDTARLAVEVCRKRRQPVFLHLRVSRLMGHAGSDVEQVYRSHGEIVANLRRDPLLNTAREALALGLASGEELRERYEGIRKACQEAAREAATRPRLETPAEIAEPLAPYDADAVAAEARRRAEVAPGTQRPRAGKPLHLAGMINRSLYEAMEKYPEAMVFGEDVAKKGGVYNVTAGLWKTFGPGRVYNTILDEQAILGLAVGAAHLGLLPIPEIQYLAYYHNAQDQIRGEACSLQFFSRGKFQNPLVMRVAAYGYQKGFGGHFHNDNSIAALRDVPGLIIASPARGDDAWRMMRTCLALARSCGRVIAYLEPIARYMTRDLYEEGDGLWLSEEPGPDDVVPLGAGRVYHEDAGDLTIVSYANGLYMSLRAARTLEQEHGIRARVIDLRWLLPFDEDLVIEHARATGKLLFVDECRRTGSLGETVLGRVLEAGGVGRAKLVAGDDTYIPLGPAMNTVLPSEDDIVAAARELAG
jgi:2-oxoisovalerate dehydrogenase E1 component